MADKPKDKIMDFKQRSTRIDPYKQEKHFQNQKSPRGFAVRERRAKMA
jgi:hypothetical protein